MVGACKRREPIDALSPPISVTRDGCRAEHTHSHPHTQNSTKWEKRDGTVRRMQEDQCTDSLHKHVPRVAQCLAALLLRKAIVPGRSELCAV